MVAVFNEQVVIDRWLFDRLLKEAAGSAADLGSICDAGQSVATVAYLFARGLWPEGVWMHDETAGYCAELRHVFPAVAEAEFVEELGKMIEQRVSDRRDRERRAGMVRL